MAGRIDDLRKRLEAQPASRLFAQLAEELRKDGKLDEAIRICRDGLRQHPAYPSAHMTLGRALFDKGDLAGARGEFESVVTAAPDNILAGRLLGECLEGLGESAAALKRYETTLLLAPDDAQLVSRLQGLRTGESPKEGSGPRTVPPEGMRRAAAQSVVAAAVASAASSGEAATRDGAEARPRPQQPASDAREAASAPAAAAPIEAGGAAAPASGGDEPAGTIPFERPEATEARPAVGEAPPEPGPTPDEEERSATSRTLPFGTPAPKLPTRRPGPPRGPVRRPETTPVSVESVRRALAETEAGESAAPGGEIATPTLAELYLKQGHPQKALDVYRSILARDPDDAEVRRRLERLEREEGDRTRRRRELEGGIDRLERLLSAVQRGRRV